MLYIFNPDHDLALAANSKYYTSPLSARQFAYDIAALPAWYAERGALLLSSTSIVDTFFALNGDCKVIKKPFGNEIVEPWGWNLSLKAQLVREGVDSALLSHDDTIYNICMLQHRRTASQLANRLRSISGSFPPPAIECATIDEVKAFAAQGNVLFKSPWSGSGRGLVWADMPMSPQQLSRCNKLIATQGGVMGEQRQHVVQDFALEFEKRGDVVTFLGYSVFNTQNGVYQCSVLASEEERKHIIAQYIEVSLLDEVQRAVAEFLVERATDYQGVIGVDMFVYQDGKDFRLNPAVEINFRYTMGYVALMFSNRFLAEGAKGHFFIDHFATSGQLVSDHRQRQSELPLKISNDKIVSGYLSLCDIGVDTMYRARVEIDR